MIQKNSIFPTRKAVQYIMLFAGCFAAMNVHAQRDTTKKQTIDITSAYKPVLRNAVKINFSASQLITDTAKLVGPYSIPAQNLFYTYQPVSLKPLALDHDPLLNLGSRYFVKLGFGNFTTPYVSAGAGFGDGKQFIANAYADYISSKGNIKYQDYSKINIKAAGSYFTPKLEIYGGLGFEQNEYKRYGYNHALVYSKAAVLQRFDDISFKAGVRNKAINESGINYNPSLELHQFTSAQKLSETSIKVELPIDKTINDVFTFKLSGKLEYAAYSSKNVLPANYSISNTVFQLAPELVYAKPLFSIHAGVTPAWDNTKLNVLPNIYGEVKLKDKPFLIQGGFVGRYIQNSYRHLSSINPYLLPVRSQKNTKEIELFGGIKGSLAKHFNFSAKAGIIRISDMPLFINDTTNALDTKDFFVSNDSRVNDLRIHGDVSYVNQDKLTITGGLTFNGYSGMQNNARAWGTVPLEMEASVRWWAFKQILLKADFKAFTGGPYLQKGNIDKSTGGGADLNAGMEFALTKKISAWMDVNNILNNKYERWHSYEVYGLNLLGGVLIKF